MIVVTGDNEDDLLREMYKLNETPNQYGMKFPLIK
jgi:hypothetical protein